MGFSIVFKIQIAFKNVLRKINFYLLKYILIDIKKFVFNFILKLNIFF